MRSILQLLKLLLLFLLYIIFLFLDRPIKDWLSNFMDSDFTVASIGTIITHLPLIIFFRWLLRKLNLENFNGLKEGIISENRKYIWIPVIFLVLVIFNNFSAFKYPETTDLILYLLGLLFIGITDEILFRGIFLPRFIRTFKNMRNSVLVGILISSILFALVHYFNLFFNASFAETSFQVVGAFCMGILLCGLLLKTKSILIPILVHSIWNLNETIGFFRFIKRQQVSEVEVSEGIGNLPQMVFSEMVTRELPVIFFLLIAGSLLIYKSDLRERYLFAIKR